MWSGDKEFPPRGNLAILLLGVLIFSVAVWMLIQHGLRRDEESAQPIGAALTVFGLLFALSLTLGRAHRGLGFAASSFYTIDNLVTLVGIYLLFIGQRSTVRTKALLRNRSREVKDNGRPMGDWIDCGCRHLFAGGHGAGERTFRKLRHGMHLCCKTRSWN